MKKNINTFLDEAYYHYLLDNGLNVYIIEKEDFSKSCCYFATNFGSLNLKQKINGEIVEFHSGIAHFLEHKLFESENLDIIDQFSSLDAQVNAYTSYNETVYYFSTITNDLKSSLNLLLDFVQNFNVSEKGVEKEKDIIIQEVLMYKNNPNYRLFSESLNSLYHHNYIKDDIGGSVEDIKAISKKELEKCYYANYHPCNMVLVIVSPFKHQDIIKIVKDNQNKKTFKNINVINIKNDEPETTVNEYKEIIMPIETQKCCYGLKLNIKINNSEYFKLEQIFKMAFEMIFSELNSNYQKWIDDLIINNFFSYYIDINTNNQMLLFTNETRDHLSFKKFIDDKLLNYTFDENKMIKLKRRYLGSLFSVFDNIDRYANKFTDNILNKKSLFECLNLINSIQIEDLYKAMELINLDNYSLIKIIGKE